MKKICQYTKKANKILKITANIGFLCLKSKCSFSCYFPLLWDIYSFYPLVVGR